MMPFSPSVVYTMNGAPANGTFLFPQSSQQQQQQQQQQASSMLYQPTYIIASGPPPVHGTYCVPSNQAPSPFPPQQQQPQAGAHGGPFLLDTSALSSVPPISGPYTGSPHYLMAPFGAQPVPMPPNACESSLYPVSNNNSSGSNANRGNFHTSAAAPQMFTLVPAHMAAPSSYLSATSPLLAQDGSHFTFALPSPVKGTPSPCYSSAATLGTCASHSAALNGSDSSLLPARPGANSSENKQRNGNGEEEERAARAPKGKKTASATKKGAAAAGTPLASIKKGAAISERSTSAKDTTTTATTTAAAALPEAKPYDEDPVPIDTTKRQLIVNYLPQKLSNEDFKSLFRRFGELEEEKSHIVFDFRTAGGVNAELFAWYWKRRHEDGNDDAKAGRGETTEQAGVKSEEDIQRDRFFAELIKKVDFSKVERQMRSKGYGFIYYKDGASTEGAMKQLNGYELHGRRIKVRYAEQQRDRSSEPANLHAAAGHHGDANADGHGHATHERGALSLSSPTLSVAHSPTPSDDAVPQPFLEGAEPVHITSSAVTSPMLLKGNHTHFAPSLKYLDTADVDLPATTGVQSVKGTKGVEKGEARDEDSGTAHSEQSIISSVYELLLGVDAE